MSNEINLINDDLLDRLIRNFNLKNIKIENNNIHDEQPFDTYGMIRVWFKPDEF